MKTLIAGFGNIFFNDDGFGPAVAKLMQSQPSAAESVRIRDFGISGMHLALEMLDGYDLVVLVDALAREDAPGTLFLLEPEAVNRNAAPDAHAMDVGGVLSLYEGLARDMPPEHAARILIAGCVPQSIEDGMELSAPVAAAVPRCAAMIHELLVGVTL